MPPAGPSRARLLITACALVLAALCAAPATAAEPAPDRPAPTEADKARAADWYELALAAMERKAYAEAALAFDAAHRLDPDARLLFNAARAYQRADNLEPARQRYEDFLIYKDADGELRERALKEMVAIEVELQKRKDEARQDADAARLKTQLEDERRAREAAEAKAAMEARLRRLEAERTDALAAAAASGSGQTAPPRFERPEGKVPIRVFTNLKLSYQVLVRDAQGNEHRCPRGVLPKQPCRLYIAPGPYRLQSRGGLELNETFNATNNGHSVNLRESPTGLIVATSVSWGSFGLGIGFIALGATVADGDASAQLGLIIPGSLLLLGGMIAAPIFSILLGQEDSYTEVNSAKDFDPATQSSARTRPDATRPRWTGVGFGPLPEGDGGMVGSGFTF